MTAATVMLRRSGDVISLFCVSIVRPLLPLLAGGGGNGGREKEERFAFLRPLSS